MLTSLLQNQMYWDKLKAIFSPSTLDLTILSVNFKLKKKCFPLESFLIVCNQIIVCRPDLLLSPLSSGPCFLSIGLICNPAQYDFFLQCASRTLLHVSTCAHRCNDVQGFCHLTRVLPSTLCPLVLGATYHLNAQVARHPVKVHHSEVAQRESLSPRSLMSPP